MTIEQERIKERRIAKNLTQNDMAALLGISQPAYQQLESGRTKDMRISTLKRLCTILETSSDYIIGLTNNPEASAKN